ncbi:hypothetical protein DFS34DRAFT_160666 [Phlyctochytrium arcticum]|nr:hypothetical protein DFS34DRAFT_160666 [Phlyctochytrium arcticum]
MSAEASFKSYTPDRLKEELKRRKLPLNGKRGAMLARLEQYETLSGAESEASDPGSPVRGPHSPQDAQSLPETTTVDRVEARRLELLKIRNDTRLWNSPFVVLMYLALYLRDALIMGLKAMIVHMKTVIAIFVLFLAGAGIYLLEGPHQGAVAELESKVVWYGWWLVLGVASSIGLGTGLHTFVLFLGPHIAHVTITAYQCQSLDFEVRGPDSFACEAPTAGAATAAAVTVWQIAKKVRWESFFWGMGTSIGELPPYFVARAAAEAGRDDQGFASIESQLAKPKNERTWGEQGQILMYKLVQSLGFFGILLCASIPNPLFDLAGIVCGHFGVPFMTFFGATFLGKAVFKSSIQTFSVILILSEDILAFILAELKERVPSVHMIVQKVLDEQVKKYQKRADGAHIPTKNSGKTAYFGMAWNALLACMIGYFFISLLESLAMAQMKKEHDREIRRLQRRASRQPSRENLTAPEAHAKTA